MRLKVIESYKLIEGGSYVIDYSLFRRSNSKEVTVMILYLLLSFTTTKSKDVGKSWWMARLYRLIKMNNGI